MRLVITRPRDDAARTAEPLRAAGHDVLVAPLLRIEAVAADFGRGPWAAVLMTSANAARVISAHPRAEELKCMPAFTVGARTAAAARATEFANVASADGAMSDLVGLIVRRLPGAAPLLYLAGEDRSGDLARELGRHGYRVDTAVIYRAVAVAELPEPLRAALQQGSLDGALHYSRRSAAMLLRLAAAAGVLNAVISLKHYCLSAEVAVPLRDAAASVAVACSPDEAALLELVGHV